MGETSKADRPLRRFRWYFATPVFVAVVCAGIFFRIGNRPVPVTTFSLQNDLSIELIDMLHGSRTEFQPDEPFNLSSFLAKKLPIRLTHKLIKWHVIDPHTAFGSGPFSSGWSANISSPDSLGLVFRLKPSGELARLFEADISKAMGRIKKVTEDRDGSVIRPRFRVLLASPDRRYAETAPLQINNSFGSTGAVGSSGYQARYEPYAQSPFQWVALNYPELDLTLLKGSENQIESSSTVRIKNPLFRNIPAPPAQTLPATAEKDGVTLILNRVIGDGAQNTRSRKSRAGEDGGELYRLGTILKADLDSGEAAQTYLNAQILEDGIPSKAWVLSQEKFLYGDGSRIGSGTSMGSLGDGYYHSEPNVAVAGGPVKARLTVRRDSGFPADEITTLALPLPPKGEAILLEQTAKFWNGEVKIDGVGNQYGSPKAVHLGSSSVGSSYNDLIAPESIKLQITGPVGYDNFRLHSIALSNESTSRPLTSNMSSVMSGVAEKEARYGFICYVNFGSTKIDTSPYTTVTVVLTAPRKIEFEFTVEPELATVPAEPVKTSIWW